MKSKVFTEELPSMGRAERIIINKMIDSFNKQSPYKIEYNWIEVNELSINFDSYDIFGDEDKKLMKFSFEDDGIILNEFELLKHLSPLGFTIEPIDIQRVKSLNKEGVLALYKNNSSFSMLQLSYPEIFSDLKNYALKDFLVILAKLSTVDISSVTHPVHEMDRLETVGDFNSIVGEKIAERINLAIHFDDDVELFKRLKNDLKTRLRRLSMRSIVNGRITPDTLSIQPPDGKEKHPMILTDWSNAFIGNPLYNLLNFLLEFRLFNLNESAKSIFFEQVGKIDGKLSEKLQSQFSDYLNYFIVYQIWEVTKQVFFIIAVNESKLFGTNLIYDRTRLKFNTIKGQAKKIVPFCENYIDKLDKFINNPNIT